MVQDGAPWCKTARDDALRRTPVEAESSLSLS